MPPPPVKVLAVIVADAGGPIKRGGGVAAWGPRRPPGRGCRTGLDWSGCGLRGPAPAQLGLLLLAALVGAAVGLAISAAARSSEAATALLPVVLIPMVLLGGAVQPRHKMGEASRALAQAAPTRWAFEGLLLSEAEARPTFRPPAPPGAPRPDRRDVAR